jgi:DNA-binding response OmpR family regulator
VELPSVLIVDDDPNIAPLVKAALKPYRIYSEAVFDGEEALTRIRQRAYDLVILDLEMGDMHGFDILRLLREQSRSAHVRVLILTGNSSHEALARSFGYGADEFMTKPFNIEELGIRAFRLIRPARQ